MSKSYKVTKKVINMGDHKGETVYTVRPYSYGILTTEEVAKQISEESSATAGDVKAVLDRYAYYVKENLKKGYDIELLGFGKLYIRFLNGKAVSEEKKANAKLVKAIVPAFRPSFTLLNGNRIYSLLPDKVTLVKYGDEDDEKGNGTSGGSTDTPTGGSSDDKKNPSGEGGSSTGGSSSDGDGTVE